MQVALCSPSVETPFRGQHSWLRCWQWCLLHFGFCCCLCLNFQSNTYMRKSMLCRMQNELEDDIRADELKLTELDGQLRQIETAVDSTQRNKCAMDRELSGLRDSIHSELPQRGQQAARWCTEVLASPKLAKLGPWKRTMNLWTQRGFDSLKWQSPSLAAKV